MGRVVVGQSVDESLKSIGDFFQGRDDVHETMRRLAARLREEQIPYALIGGMALMLHGFKRVTGDVDVITTREGLEAIHQRLIGNGYEGKRRRIRDSDTGISIDFFISGEYPGDGKPKPVVFPDPAEGVVRDGIVLIDFPKLIELKLASGLSSEWRYLHDLGDVAKLISELRLPRELADQLDLSVRPEYIRMWEAWKNRPTTAPDYEHYEP